VVGGRKVTPFGRPLPSGGRYHVRYDIDSGAWDLAQASAPGETPVTTSGSSRAEGRQQLPAAEQPLPPPPGAARAGGPKRAVSEESLERVVEAIRAHIQVVHRQIQFSVDEQSGETIIKVVDADTQEVIRQIPPEEMIAIAQQLSEGSGMLLRTKA
jgi:flagellar protein FlaG